MRLISLPPSDVCRHWPRLLRKVMQYLYQTVPEYNFRDLRAKLLFFLPILYFLSQVSDFTATHCAYCSVHTFVTSTSFQSEKGEVM